jgi:hypothetical protein
MTYVFGDKLKHGWTGQGGPGRPTIGLFSGVITMQLFCSSIGTAAVAMIYLIYGVYRDHVGMRFYQDRVLRERVTYMLWVMANQID